MRAGRNKSIGAKADTADVNRDELSTSVRERAVIEGIVSRSPVSARRHRHGFVLLRPWRCLWPWTTGDEHMRNWNLAAPIRIRVGSEASSLIRFSRGVAIRIACEDVRPPPGKAATWRAASYRLPQTLDAENLIAHRDRLLGTLVLNTLTNTISGSRANQYELHLERSTDDTACQADVRRARAFVAGMEKRMNRIRKEISARLIAGCDEPQWRDYLDRLSRKEILARIKLASVDIRSDGQAKLRFSSGKLLGGHWVEALLDSTFAVRAVKVDGACQAIL
jgi:hypothetical protein